MEVSLCKEYDISIITLHALSIDQYMSYLNSYIEECIRRRQQKN